MRAPLSVLLLGAALAAAPGYAQEEDEWGEDWDEAAPAAPEAPEASPAPAAEPAAPARSAPAAPPTDPADAVVEDRGDGPRLGDPTPLSRREPSLGAKTLGVNIRYGLVGTGPTRFVNDVRYGLTDWLELRTSFQPFPSSLMARVTIGSQQSRTGAVILEGGLAHLDVGLRIVPDLGETDVGLRAHLEASVAHAIALGSQFSTYVSAHYRYRASGLDNDQMHAVSADAQLTYDLLPYLSLTGGLGVAGVLGDRVPEIVVAFVETSRPGMNHILHRDDGELYSVTVPLALTYGRTESFDVDIFCTPRVAPRADVVFGAGVRWRADFSR